MSQTFIKSHVELIQLGVPVRAVLVYGQLEFMAGTKGEAWPTQGKLAKACGLEIRQLENLLNHLRRLKLVHWKRGRYYNSYRVLKPDTQFIADLNRKPDPQRSAHPTRNEFADLRSAMDCG